MKHLLALVGTIVGLSTAAGALAANEDGGGPQLPACGPGNVGQYWIDNAHGHAYRCTANGWVLIR